MRHKTGYRVGNKCCAINSGTEDLFYCFVLMKMYQLHFPSQIKSTTPFVLVLFEATFTLFFKVKGHNEDTKQWENQGFFTLFFCLMIEGPRSGFVPRANDSGFERPKSIQILIRNTAVRFSKILTCVLELRLLAEKTASWSYP